MVELPQWVANLTLGAAMATLGWLVRVLWEAQRKLTDELKQIELNVAENYVHRRQFDDTIKALFNKLDRIEDKLDRKADKPHLMQAGD